MVANNTFVRAQRQDTARFFSATVVAINQDCDLYLSLPLQACSSSLIEWKRLCVFTTRALLEVSNPKFFDGLKPLQFVDTPSLQNTVVVFVRVASLHIARIAIACCVRLTSDLAPMAACCATGLSRGR